MWFRISSRAIAVTALLGTALAATAPAQTSTWGEAVVHRDGYGVPHVFGPTDESVLFAAAWVQAEADWGQIERNFLRSTGRATEVVGEDALLDDYLARAFEIPRLAREEYERATPKMRGMLEAYAAGFDAYLEAHPDERRLLDEVEPWHTLALIRFKYHQLEFLAYAGFEEAWAERLLREGGPGEGAASAAVARADGGSRGAALADWTARSITRFAADLEGPMGPAPFGSNEWALGPSRTADGTTMLLVNPHQSFFGVERYVEIHLHSDEGLVFSGLTRFGFLLPYMGHGARHGWTYTDNYADISDLYVESFDDPDEPLAYRYGEGHREAETWTETIRLTDGETRTLRFWKTHHGPVVGRDDDGRILAAKLPKLEEGGWFDQLDAMIRAGSLEEFKAAVGRLSIPYMNTMYADVEGNIGYVYNSAVPRRDPRFDWREPVDGSDPATEWDGYHDLEELPQVWNPPSGWLVNTNSSPMVVTDPAPYAREDFPAYMIGSETDNPRARSSRRVIDRLEDATLDDFSIAAWDSYLSLADSLVPALLEQRARLEASADSPASLAPGSPGRARLDEALRRLEAWDRVADVESVETTWFVIGFERWWLANRAGREGPFVALEVLAEALEALEEAHGTTEVAWGEVNRLQRPPSDDPEDLSDALPSLPVGGAGGWAGSVFVFGTDQIGEVGRRYGRGGNTFVKVIELGPDVVRGRSVVVFGQSGDPDSPHFFDQAPLYADRRFKEAWFHRADVEANAAETSRPGR